ncbi:hypothetical protein [Streptomyces varsoviensis]|uniref:hypothetical protein n=1 Tax=Streptomyces varsoviensis TaxID=67373 RepID=UPI000B09274B|nr:hypothetical protein [Streptomyces varsoviensis]
MRHQDVSGHTPEPPPHASTVRLIVAALTAAPATPPQAPWLWGAVVVVVVVLVLVDSRPSTRRA